ncbi:MAG: glycosyltransferase [Desulfomonile tiedjei]|nr:glycosyltransferase [Desulfomonile tiedjei]
MLRVIPRDACRMDVCCKGDDKGPWAWQAEELGAEVYHCPLRPSHIGFMRGLERLLKTGRYDVVHNHLGVYSGFPVWISHRAGVPVISTFHTTRIDDPHNWWLRLPILTQLRRLYGRISINYAVRNSELVTGVSKGVLENMAPDKCRISGQCRVLYLGTDVPPAPTPQSRVDFRTALGLSAQAPLVLHVGRFMEQKNHVGLIAIFERVLLDCPETKLLLVGEGILKESIKALVENLGLGTSVLFLGHRNDVADIMRNCDVFLLPSFYEGLPVVALEANAASLPLVGSRIPGLAEAVEEGRTAILHDVDDIRGMADSVVRLLTDPASARRLGEAGRERIQQEFSAEAGAKRLLELYAECRPRVRAQAGG